MRLFLIVMLGLSTLIDLILGGWMLLAWDSFARRWAASAWESFASGQLLSTICDTSVLGFTLGLFVLSIAGLTALCALWTWKRQREGLSLSLLLGIGLLIFGIALSVRTGTTFNLALDSLRGLLIAAPAFSLLRREPENVPHER